MNKREKGKLGENIASEFLKKKGIRIIERNYFTKYGEIDLIGIQNQTIIFIEVKLRNSDNYGLPWEGIDSKKINKIQKSAMLFLQKNNYDKFDCRFDVISLNYDSSTDCYKINWLENQFID